MREHGAGGSHETSAFANLQRFDRLTAREVTEWLLSALHRTEIGDDLLDYVLQAHRGQPVHSMVQLLSAPWRKRIVFRFSGTSWEWIMIPTALNLQVRPG